MKSLTLLLLLCAWLASASTPATPAEKTSHTQEQTAARKLHAKILKLDRRYFEAYNTCDLETQAEMLSDELEFYHDQSGLMTSKLDLLEAIEQNICGKVTRELVEGSVEVYPIGEDGAVEIGLHRFFNSEEPDAPSHGVRFVTIWRKQKDAWKMSRMISVHSPPKPH
jgi:ketosteroid isomerase-like protein